MDATLEALFPPEERVELIKYEAILNEDKDLMAGLIANRSVDDFLTYVSHLMKLPFHTKPEILQATVQIKLADALRLPNRESIIQYAIDEYVQKLTYQSLRDLYRDLKNRTDFQLFTSPTWLNAAVEAVAIRNVLVHNNGLVDTRLAEIVQRYKGKEGQRVVDFNPTTLQSLLVLAVIDIDERARKKWGLPGGTMTVPHMCHRLESVVDARERKATDSDGELQNKASDRGNGSP
jgi:hypothetical protein